MIVQRYRDREATMITRGRGSARVAGGDIGLGSFLVLVLAGVGGYFLYKNYKVSRR